MTAVDTINLADPGPDSADLQTALQDVLADPGLQQRGKFYDANTTILLDGSYHNHFLTGPNDQVTYLVILPFSPLPLPGQVIHIEYYDGGEGDNVQIVAKAIFQYRGVQVDSIVLVKGSSERVTLQYDATQGRWNIIDSSDDVILLRTSGPKISVRNVGQAAEYQIITLDDTLADHYINVYLPVIYWDTSACTGPINLNPQWPQQTPYNGTWYNTSNNDLTFSPSQFRVQGGGQPTSITLGNFDQINVYWTKTQYTLIGWWWTDTVIGGNPYIVFPDIDPGIAGAGYWVDGVLVKSAGA